MARPFGYVKPGLEPSLHPTIRDIAWAAGIVEGEGTIDSTPAERVTVVQKKLWILKKLQRLFGGSVRIRISLGFKRGKVGVWMLCGARARGLMMSMYTSLSPHRKKSVRLSLQGRTYASKAWLKARGLS